MQSAAVHPSIMTQGDVIMQVEENRDALGARCGSTRATHSRVMREGGRSGARSIDRPRSSRIKNVVEQGEKGLGRIDAPGWHAHDLRRRAAPSSTIGKAEDAVSGVRILPCWQGGDWRSPRPRLTARLLESVTSETMPNKAGWHGRGWGRRRGGPSLAEHRRPGARSSPAIRRPVGQARGRQDKRERRCDSPELARACERLGAGEPAAMPWIRIASSDRWPWSGCTTALADLGKLLASAQCAAAEARLVALLISEDGKPKQAAGQGTLATTDRYADFVPNRPARSPNADTAIAIGMSTRPAARLAPFHPAGPDRDRIATIRSAAAPARAMREMNSPAARWTPSVGARPRYRAARSEHVPDHGDSAINATRRRSNARRSRSVSPNRSKRPRRAG